jgi:glypican 4 (K-glypican)
LGRQRRAYPIYNSNSDLFIDDEPDSESTNDRSKRAADATNTEVRNRNSQEIKVERLKFDHQENYSGNRGGANRGRNQSRPNQRGSFTNGKSDNSRESNLDKLVKEIRQKVKDTRKFWSNLPYTACNNDDFASAGNSDSCWNGQSVNR